MLWRIYNIEDLSFLEGIDSQPTFSSPDRKEDKEGKEMEQEVQ